MRNSFCTCCISCYNPQTESYRMKLNIVNVIKEGIIPTLKAQQGRLKIFNYEPS